MRKIKNSKGRKIKDKHKEKRANTHKQTHQTNTHTHTLVLLYLSSLSFPHFLLVENWDWDRIDQFKIHWKNTSFFFLQIFILLLFFINPFSQFSPINQSITDPLLVFPNPQIFFIAHLNFLPKFASFLCFKDEWNWV
jgi:uncharacterized membrane protein